MNKAEFIKKIDENGLRHIVGGDVCIRYVEMWEIVNEDGSWRKMTDVCGCYYKDDKWKIFFTDGERGVVQIERTYETEDEAYDELYRRLELEEQIYKESNEYIIIYYMINDRGYKLERAKSEYKDFSQHQDISDEFANFIKTNKYEGRDGSQISVEGYTACRLKQETTLSPLGIYNYLIYLREEPKEAIEYLKKGLPRR